MHKTGCQILVVSLLSGCLFLGESVSEVSGRVMDENKQAYSHCYIDLFINQDNHWQRLKYKKRKIEFNNLSFRQLFVIESRPKTYQVEITCDGSSQSFMSSPLRLPDTDTAQTPIDLGVILLIRN